MSLSSAMNVGVSGLGINAEGISVVGNNIANVNTVGFKEGRTIFSDMLSANIGTGQVGRGAQIQTIQNMFSQGSFENTAGENDLALQGESFFVLEDSSGTRSYTRAGAFDYNNSQVLVNPDGLEVVGFGITQATGLSNGVEGKIDKTAFATLPPQTTTAASFVMNLDSTTNTPGSSVTSSVRLDGDFGTALPATNPTPVTFYDEFGNAQAANITWAGVSPTFTYSIAIPNATAGTPGSAGFQITGTLNFPTPTTSTVSTTVSLNNGAKPMPVTFDLSNMKNTAAATAPTVTANGAAITTANEVLTGGTGPVVIPTIALTGGGAGAATVYTDQLGTAITVNTELTDTNAITLTGGGAGVATTAFDKAGTAYAVAVKPANTNAVALSGGGAGLNTTVFGSTGTSHALVFTFGGGTVNMTVDGGAPAAVGTYTDDGTNFTSAVTWTTPQLVDGASIALSDTLNTTLLAGVTTATSAGDISNFVGAAAAVKNGAYTANATNITSANVATTANILIGAGATQATAILSDVGIVGGLLGTASTVTSAGSLAYSTAGAAGPYTAFGTYAADATNVTASTVAPGTTIVAGADTPIITANLAGNALAAATIGVANGLVPAGTGTFVDSTGVSHAIDIYFDSATTWHANIAGATPALATISGTFNSAANGKSTWSQNSSSVTIGGVTQPVSFDLSNVTTGITATAVRANGWDKTNPAVTANFSNSTQLYDSQGNAHPATVYYSKTGANQWDYHLVVPDAVSINGMAGNTTLNGTLSFNSAGTLINQMPSNVNGFTVRFPGNVASQTVAMDFNPNVSTQLASNSVLSYQNQNGYGAGNLISTKIDDQGYVNASYTNNQTQRIALVALAKFAAVAGLEKIGNSLFTSTAKSGFAIIGTADLQGSKIFTKSLEQSNVDMATQLVNMIKLQRAYSGNSKTITSSDEMMQETLSLKR